MTENNSNRFPVNRKLLTRIFSKIKVSTKNFYKGVPCWEWQAYKTKLGYGQISYKPKWWYAHRLIYCFFVEIVPTGLECDHLCRNPSCVNPVHIEPVAPKINKLRGISPAAQNAKKTHCHKGHPLSGDNLKIGDYRICLTCSRERALKAYYKNLTPRKTATHPRR